MSSNTNYEPITYTHVAFPVTIQLHQNLFDPNVFTITLSEEGQGKIHQETTNNIKDAMRIYLGMIADEHDDHAPNEISAMVNR